MESNVVYDYGSIDEAIIIHIGAAIYDDEPLAHPAASTVSDQANHDLSAEEPQDEPGFSDLLSHSYDVDGLPEDSDFSLYNASVYKDESTPWHPARAYGTSERDLQPNELLASPRLTDANGGRDSNNGPCRACHADAHSSTNGISQWPDFSTEDDLPECSCTHSPTDSTSPTSLSSSVQLVGSGLSQGLPSITSMSQWDARDEVAHDESAVNESPTSLRTGPVESTGASDPRHPETPVESLIPEEPASNISANPPNNTSTARPYSCSSCGKGFMTKADVRHHKQLHDPDKQSAQRCPECDYTCHHLKDMSRHREKHVAKAERHRYPCPNEECPRSFTRKDNAARHAKRDHTTQAPE